MLLGFTPLFGRFQWHSFFFLSFLTLCSFCIRLGVFSSPTEIHRLLWWRLLCCCGSHRRATPLSHCHTQPSSASFLNTASASMFTPPATPLPHCHTPTPALLSFWTLLQLACLTTIKLFRRLSLFRCIWVLLGLWSSLILSCPVFKEYMVCDFSHY